MLGPLPQNQIALARWQLKRELQHPIFKRYAEHKLLGIPPAANPFVFRAEEHPTRSLWFRRIQFHGIQAVRAQELLPFGGLFLNVLKLCLKLVSFFRVLPNLALSLITEFIGVAL